MPLIVDLEGDQNWELIFTTHDNTMDWYRAAGFSMYSVDLGRFAERLAWGGYQGSLADGFYPQELVLGLEASSITGISIYPNPVQETLSVRSIKGQKIDNILLYDSQGTLVAASRQTHILELSHLPEGLYLYRIQLDERVASGRLIKR
ncbi:MAG: T9SS type A sorting domain-containing protein [Bacteroidota bacterium]